MIRLQPDQFDMIRHLVTSKNDFYPLMESAIDRVIDGNIYVDRMPDPANALIYTESSCIYFLGEIENAEFIKDVLKLFEDKHDGHVIWFGISDAWKKRMLDQLTCEAEDYPRYRFYFSEEDFRRLKAYRIPYKIEAIDKSNVELLGNFSEVIIDYWKSMDTFLDCSLGYIAVDNGRAIGCNAVISISKNHEAELNVEVDPEYQGQGISKALGHAMISRCLEMGLTPKVDCLIDNEPSRRSALSFGFHIAEQYPVSVFAFY